MRHVGIQVKDTERAIRWYRKLGFRGQMTRTETWSGKHIETTKLELIQGDWKPHFAMTFPLVRHKVEPGRVVVFTLDSEGNEVEMVFETKP